VCTLTTRPRLWIAVRNILYFDDNKKATPLFELPWQHSTLYIADSDVYLTQYKGKELLYFHGNTFDICILLRVTCIANNTQKTHRCFCKATMRARTTHDLTLSVECLSCYKPLTLLVPCNSSFGRTYFVKTTNQTQRPNKQTVRHHCCQGSGTNL